MSFDDEEAVIGLRSIVRPGARLRRVVMMGADFYEAEDDQTAARYRGRPPVGIGQGASIERAIIDKNARIGQGVVICSHEGQPDCDMEHFCVREGIVVIPRNAVIPDGTTISPQLDECEWVELAALGKSRVPVST